MFALEISSSSVCVDMLLFWLFPQTLDCSSVIFSDHTHWTPVCNKLPSDQNGFIYQMFQGSSLAEIYT